MKLLTSIKGQAVSFLEKYKKKSPATYAAAEQAVGGIMIIDGLVGIDPPFSGENKRPGIFGTLVIIIVGVIFTLVPNFIGSVTDINNMTASTTATVVSVTESDDGDVCGLKVRYVVDGKEYVKISSIRSSNSCAFSEGDKVNIKYNPDRPASWSNDTNFVNIFVQIFFWVGIFAIISGFVKFIIRLLSIIFGWKLLRHGRKLAKELPEGTDIDTIKNEIKAIFTKAIFSSGSKATNPLTEESILPKIDL